MAQSKAKQQGPFFQRHCRQPGQKVPDLNFMEFEVRAEAALDAIIIITAKIKGDVGNTKRESHPVTLLDLVTNQNPNDNGDPFDDAILRQI